MSHERALAQADVSEGSGYQYDDRGQWPTSRKLTLRHARDLITETGRTHSRHFGTVTPHAIIVNKADPFGMVFFPVVAAQAVVARMIALEPVDRS